MAIRVILADDHAILRQGLRALLERAEIEVLAETGDGQEAVKLASELRPDVALIDFSMPSLNGIDASKAIQRGSPRTRAILLTMHRDDAYVLGAMQAGMCGYVLKTQAAEELVQAIREVMDGKIYLSPGISKTVVQALLTKSDVPSDPLTARERQVLQLVAEGNSTKEIAVLLGLSVKTVESHRGRIMEKLNIHDVAGLVRYAIRIGIVSP